MNVADRSCRLRWLRVVSSERPQAASAETTAIRPATARRPGARRERVNEWMYIATAPNRQRCRRDLLLEKDSCIILDRGAVKTVTCPPGRAGPGRPSRWERRGAAPAGAGGSARS